MNSAKAAATPMMATVQHGEVMRVHTITAVWVVMMPVWSASCAEGDTPDVQADALTDARNSNDLLRDDHGLDEVSDVLQSPDTVDPKVDAVADGDVTTVDTSPSCSERTPAAIDDLLGPFDAMLKTFEDYSYMSDILPLDPVAIRKQAYDTLQCDQGDPDRELLGVLAHAMRLYRNGHAGLYSTTGSCRGLGGSDLSSTYYGVCAKPHDGAFVVTHQPGDLNPLGLTPGERIIAVNGVSGEALDQSLLAGPLCGNGIANDEVAREHAAESLFAVIDQGDALTIEGLDGQERVVIAGPRSSQEARCRYPSAANNEPLASSYLRPDGVGVITVRRFYLYAGEPGWIDVKTLEDAQQLVENIIGLVKTAFDSVAPSASATVWDVRANIGGASPAGFAIAAGMPGAKEVPIARCTTRIPGSNPPAYYFQGPDYDLSPDDRFAFGGPTAVLIDGLAISAGDYFARAVMLGTEGRLFGRPTAGAYGGGGQGLVLDEGRGLYLSYDPYRCNDIDGAPLETLSVAPDAFVEYAPADLADGVDTVLEAAVQWALSEQ